VARGHYQRDQHCAVKYGRAASEVKIVFKAMLVVALLAISLLAVSLSWFYFYSGDLPDFAAVTNFAPVSATTVPDRCSTRAIAAIPFTALGKGLQNATRAAEGDSKEVLAYRISHGLFCDSRMKPLERHLLEYKASVQLQRRFTFEQLLTIYLNRAYFGDDSVGVENASLHYYGKHASELDIPQAALIAGLIEAPAMYSPERHPDRAKMRRDAVISVMLKMGAITTGQAEAAVRSAIR
jgi:membrane carboxypeptidase/penicillin-binding protein